MAASEAVFAAEIAPQAFKNLVADGGESQDVEDDLHFDLRNLTVINPHQIDEEAMEARPDHFLKRQAEAAMQALVNRLFVLPTEPSEVGPVATLPVKEELVLPRAKPVPVPKAETRWDRFAREKGITGSKRSRMVWDDEMKEWRPRHGYKRANDGILNHAIVEVKAGTDPNVDPWSEARRDKKARVQKNLENRTKNVARSGKKPGPGIPLDLAPSAKDVNPGGGSSGDRKRGKANTREALTLAQQSTASMGKFDEMRNAEPERRKSKGVRRAFKPVTTRAGEEAQGHIKILNSVLLGKEKRADKEGTSRSAKESLVAYDAIEGPRDPGANRKKGRGAAGKPKKFTKKRLK